MSPITAIAIIRMISANRMSIIVILRRIQRVRRQVCVESFQSNLPALFTISRYNVP